MRNPIFGVIMWPFAKVLQVLFDICGSYGLAIILFALIIKLILLYPSAKAKRNSLQMVRMNPKMQEIKKRCGNDQQKYSEEVMKLYNEQGVNPMGGCLWSFIPVPILIALYGIIRKPLSNFMWLNEDQLMTVKDMVSGWGVDVSGVGAYQEIEWAKAAFEHFNEVVAVVPQVFKLDFSFLGIDLAAIPWHSFSDFTSGNLSWPVLGLFLIPVISGLLNLGLTLLTNRVQPDMGNNSSMKTMMIMMPIMSVYMGFILPASLGIYWIAQSLFSIIQEYALQKYFGAKLDKEDKVREEALRADRLRRMEAAKSQPQQAVKNKNTSKDKQKRQNNAPAASREYASSTTEAGRVGGRPYARGRAFNGSHYDEIDDNKDD